MANPKDFIEAERAAERIEQAAANLTAALLRVEARLAGAVAVLAKLDTPAANVSPIKAPN